jgi:hypothetical protein
MESVHRTLIVANRTAATPLLLEEVKRRAAERETTFSLLIPSADSKKHADWTMESAVELLSRAAGSQVNALTGDGDPFDSVKRGLEDGQYDDVLISTLPKRVSEWLRRDLPGRVRRLGIPVAVITQPTDQKDAGVIGVGGPM